VQATFRTLRELGGVWTSGGVCRCLSGVFICTIRVLVATATLTSRLGIVGIPRILVVQRGVWGRRWTLGTRKGDTNAFITRFVNTEGRHVRTCTCAFQGCLLYVLHFVSRVVFMRHNGAIWRSRGLLAVEEYGQQKVYIGLPHSNSSFNGRFCKFL
jgi:hypothetical protein